jgi:hypothetical protein
MGGNRLVPGLTPPGYSNVALCEGSDVRPSGRGRGQRYGQLGGRHPGRQQVKQRAVSGQQKVQQAASAGAGEKRPRPAPSRVARARTSIINFLRTTRSFPRWRRPEAVSRRKGAWRA